MGRIGKISVIKKDFSNGFPTLEKSLRDNGLSQVPGTKKGFYPSRNANGTYLTGLDEETRKRLEQSLHIDDLSPRANYWNSAFKDPYHPMAPKVELVFLKDGDNFFDFEDPMKELTFRWLSAHKMIAKSLEDYEAGLYPADTQFYVANDEYEDDQKFKKAKEINDAIALYDSFPLEKKRKTLRLMGEAVSDDVQLSALYNLGVGLIQTKSMSRGPYKGMTPVNVFNMFAKLDNEKFEAEAFVEQVLANQIYREGKGGIILEGELKIYNSKQELVEQLLSPLGQEEKLALSQKLKLKKVAKVK